MSTFVGLDDLHFTFRHIDGYNRAFNAVVSCRDPGKTTAWKLWKAYLPWITEQRPCIVLRRQAVDITDLYIDDIIASINKFLPAPLEAHYKKGSLKDGVADIYAVHPTAGLIRFIRVVALSIPAGRMKSLYLKNPSNIIFDEFIIDQKELKEKYLPGEATRFKELYNTYERECTETLKCYFLGNPYSLYNPFFSWWGVPTNKLRRGVTIAGPNWAVECYEMTDALRSSILARNPLYQFDDLYTRYAFDGVAINDSEIPLGTRPDGATLAYVIRLGERGLALFRTLPGSSVIYYAEAISLSDVSRNRTIWIVDLDDLTRNSIMFSAADKFRFQRFGEAVRTNRMTYKTIEAYYMSKEAYSQL